METVVNALGKIKMVISCADGTGYKGIQLLSVNLVYDVINNNVRAGCRI